MRTFPDEASMERSADGSEPIRGGSIGLNRILGRFTERAGRDHKPEFTAAILSAFTIFRNVLGTYADASDKELEDAFVKDVTLFLDYYDTYLSFTRQSFGMEKKCPVVVYFPDYKHVEKQIRRELTGKKAELFTKYATFLKRYNGQDERVRDSEFLSCFWISASTSTYPHKEVSRKFKDIGSQRLSYYSPGDTIALLSHIPIDLHIAGRLRGIHLLESYTGELKASDQFRFRLDKEGRLPFHTATHVVFGDSVLIKPWVTPKVRKELFELAEKDKWLTRSNEDVRNRISKGANIPLRELQKFDFV